MQAALATCNATGIAMKAAREGIELNTLEVSIDTESDARGFLGFDKSIKAGSVNVKASVLIGAKGAQEEELRDLVEQVYKYSWVGNSVRRSVPINTEVEIV